MRAEGSQRCNLWITTFILNRALEVRGEFCARLQRAGTGAFLDPDVSRLATFCPPLLGANQTRFPLAQQSCAKKVARGVTSGSPRSASIRALEVRGEFFARLQRAVIVREVIQTFHVWLPSARRCRGKLETRNPKLKTSLRPALHA
jgi:hypothetical protein